MLFHIPVRKQAQKRLKRRSLRRRNHRALVMVMKVTAVRYWERFGVVKAHRTAGLLPLHLLSGIHLGS
jgi:hypothetical protein